ncbi:hypothetical protein LguiA_008466 [Lonicera macranthoides]
MDETKGDQNEKIKYVIRNVDKTSSIDVEGYQIHDRSPNKTEFFDMRKKSKLYKYLEKDQQDLLDIFFRNADRRLNQHQRLKHTVHHVLLTCHITDINPTIPFTSGRSTSNISSNGLITHRQWVLNRRRYPRKTTVGTDPLRTVIPLVGAIAGNYEGVEPQLADVGDYLVAQLEIDAYIYVYAYVCMYEREKGRVKEMDMVMVVEEVVGRRNGREVEAAMVEAAVVGRWRRQDATINRNSPNLPDSSYTIQDLRVPNVHGPAGVSSIGIEDEVSEVANVR